MIGDKIQEAIAAMGGEPLEDIGEILCQSTRFQAVILNEYTKDGELSDDELANYKGALEVQIAAIDYEMACREKACEDAGGRDCTGDLNRAQKIAHKGYLEDLDVENVKVGQDQRKV